MNKHDRVSELNLSSPVTAAGTAGWNAQNWGRGIAVFSHEGTFGPDQDQDQVLAWKVPGNLRNLSMYSGNDFQAQMTFEAHAHWACDQQNPSTLHWFELLLLRVSGLNHEFPVKNDLFSLNKNVYVSNLDTMISPLDSRVSSTDRILTECSVIHLKYLTHFHSILWNV